MATLSGTTRDANGNPLGGCTVLAFRTSTNVLAASGTSDVDGTFSLNVPTTAEHYVVATKAGPLAGVSDNTLLPIATTEPETDAFLLAAGISDPTISDAINGLVVALKNASIWTKMHALWPFVGGTATTHKYNLVDPQDTDGAYRISWTGSWTHDANGITGDGSSAYGNTHLAPTDVLTSSSGSLGVYSRTSAAGAGQPYDFGCDDGDVKPIIVISRYSSGNSYLVYGDSSFTPNGANADGKGFYITDRNDSSTTVGYRNGVSFISATVGVTMPASGRNLFIGANNRAGTPIYYSAKNLALAFVADGLSASEVGDFYTAVQTFQAALGRDV